MQGIHGTQAGHEQQEGGAGGWAGGVLQQLLLPPPLLQQDGLHLGAHIHQTEQGEHEHPVHGLQGLHVVGASVVVVTVVVVGVSVVVGGGGFLGNCEIINNK